MLVSYTLIRARIGQLTISGGFKPVQLLASTKYVRAAPGGTGAFKLGAKCVDQLVQARVKLMM